MSISTTDLHRRSLVIDSHNDSIVALIRRGNIGLDGTGAPNPQERDGAVAYLRQYLYPLGEGIQLDIPKMRAGGLDAAFFAVDTTRPWGNHLLYGMDALGYFLHQVEACAKDIVIAREAADITRAKAEGKLAAVLAVENSNVLEQSPYILPLLYQIGVRSITLTHSARTWVADGCEVEGGGGLTKFGRLVVRQMNQLGILVDLSHINERGFWEVLETSETPPIASHSCCHHLCAHPRNLKDDQLQALAQKGGVVGLTFVPSFIEASAVEPPPLQRFLDHIDHAVEVAGIDHVGLGSDFDGGGTLLESAADYPLITAGLSDRGYAEGDIGKILGGNHLRLIQATIG